MMYTITIERDGAKILKSEIEADNVIDIFVLAQKSRDNLISEETETTRVKRKYKKRKKDDDTDGDGTPSFDSIIERKRKPPTCSLCGKKGHISFRCPSKDKNSTDDLKQIRVSDMEVNDAVAEGALDRMQFSQVRELKHKEINSKNAAEELDLDDGEVRTAYSAITYEGYLKLR